METVLEMPDDTISHGQAEVGEDGIEHCIQWNYGPVVHIVSDLPADASTRRQAPYTLLDDHRLLVQIRFQFQLLLVLLTNVVEAGAQR